jgi:VCBS repeat-containing protein
LYNYQLSPQLKILAGSTTATITLTGIDDTTDEADETIVLTLRTASNASLSSNAPITVTITDNDELPTVTFALSASKIVENSATTVTFTATPSVVSGKDITIPFTLSGTATPTTEYTVSANQIVIPANTQNASVTISTSGLDDTIVEILETINFNIGTLVNATTTTTLVTLLLESDDNPTITSIVASATTIAEHESTTITATLDQASSKDVLVSIVLSGTAALNDDYTNSFPSKGEESLIATIQGYSSTYVQLSDGRYIFTSGNALIIYDPITKTQTTQSLKDYPQTLKVLGNVVYYRSMNGPGGPSILKMDLSQSTPVEESVVAITEQGSYLYSFDVVGSTVYYLINSGTGTTNTRKIYSKTGTAAAVLVYEPTQDVSFLSVDSSGIIYIANYNSIQRINTQNNAVTNLNGNSGNNASSYSSMKLFKDQLYVVVSNGSTPVIKKVNFANNSFQTLDFATTNTKSISDFSILEDGNLQLLRYDTTSQVLLYNYQLSPQLKIPAGQTSGQLIISGIEDNLETEGTEQIILKMSAQNAILNTVTDITIDIKDNTRTLTLEQNSPFTGLENGAVAWGDFDRDGDQDVAVMGTGNTGAVTKIYENRNGVFIDTNQNFAKLYGGDISWVDLNKDGWIDLVVSGFNATPQTKVYINDKGTSFNPSAEYGLPQLYSSKMAWGDLDNDGDIDLAISGIDKDEKYVFNILYKEDNQNKFVIEPKTLSGSTCYICYSFQGFIKGDLKIVDVDLDGDNDIVYNGESSSGQPISNTIYNSHIKTATYNNYNQPLSLKNSTIEVAKMNASQSNLTVLSSGVDSNGANQFYASTILMGDNSGPGMAMGVPFPKLKSGDIAVADFNNDGTNDILFTGENSAGIPTTKLYFQDTNGNYKESPIVLEGLRNSTANWVDYDMDGDLDLFLTGTSATGGAKSLLYVSNIANKKNVAPPAVSGLIAEDLGNGKIKFKWSAPKDDYSTNLGYVIKLGTTPGGTELSNTESNLTTGTRLITKPAAIYTGFYEMQLNPGKYYWSVQAVDTGLKGGAFSAEDSFTLTYDWKILNQGGIIDRSISGIEAPVIKLADLDNDNDLDLIYANANGSGSQILRFDGKRLLADTNVSNINSFLYTINYINNINSLAVGDINGDGIADVVRNDLNSTNNLVLNLSNGTDYTSTALGGGLFKSKIKIVDMNNDGQPDIVVLGMSTNTISGLPKLWIYEYDKSTNPPSFKKTDASAQIAPLANASFDLGDIDKDQDIDLIISGFSASDGLKCIIYENVTELAGSFTLKATDNNLVAIKDGTTDFIDFDGDGDLDAVFTGTSVTNDIFEIYINKLDEGITIWPRFSSGLEPMRQSKISLGDFNGDGYSDLLYSGITGGGAGNVTKLSEYNSSTSKYTDSAFDVSDIQNAEVVFGDIDGDNDLDFVIVGKNKNYNSNDPNNINGISTPFIFRTYINVRNDSAKVLASSGKQSATKKTFSPKATTYTINEKPSVPALPSTAVKFLNNVSSKAGTYPVELSWLAASDDHTPPAGLTYALKIGTTPGAENIMGANANTSGKRKVSEKGNVEHNKKWRLSLPVGVYYWSVQAIDASYSGSEFSLSNKFEITSQGLTTIVNAAPIAVPDQIFVLKGGLTRTLVGGLTSVLTNDTDAENNTLTASLVTNVTNGTLTLNANGTFSYVHNDSETTTDSFTYKANDGTSYSNVVTVAITIAVIDNFFLPSNNFSVQVKDETCTNKSNGEINITAVASYSYVANINGKSYNFINNSLSVPNLVPGSYSICITIPGKYFEQCYTVNVAKGKTITGKLSAASNKVSIEIVEGTTPYQIFVNGQEQFQTDFTSFSVDVKKGDLLEVKTAKPCEGTYSKSIGDLLDANSLYPNPTTGSFEISLPTSRKEVVIDLYTLSSQLISKRTYQVVNEKVYLNIENESSGVYFVKIYLDTPKNLTIIKN